MRFPSSPLPPVFHISLQAKLLKVIENFCTLMTGGRILGAAKASVINILEPATGVILGVIIFRPGTAAKMEVKIENEKQRISITLIASQTSHLSVAALKIEYWEC